MAEYRKKNNSEVWHWCTNCSRWPKDDYETKARKPNEARLCKECQRKADKKDCGK